MTIPHWIHSDTRGNEIETLKNETPFDIISDQTDLIASKDPRIVSSRTGIEETDNIMNWPPTYIGIRKQKLLSCFIVCTNTKYVKDECRRTQWDHSIGTKFWNVFRNSSTKTNTRGHCCAEVELMRPLV